MAPGMERLFSRLVPGVGRRLVYRWSPPPLLSGDVPGASFPKGLSVLSAWLLADGGADGVEVGVKVGVGAAGESTWSCASLGAAGSLTPGTSTALGPGVDPVIE